MLDYRWEESITGPPRKYYQLTQRGIATAKELKISWEELVISIEKITKQ